MTEGHRPRALPPTTPMTGWFDPKQLLHTGIQALVSTVIGAHSDRRLVEAIGRHDHGYYDYTCHFTEGEAGALRPNVARPRSELWIDFVADTGDGWNSTYAVARAVAQPQLLVSDGQTVHRTERGGLLVFGGDEVYPTPSRKAYERRLLAPYAAAFGDDQPREPPHVLALPGNHDWYDSLVAWSRLFCSSVMGRRFAGWRTRQARSYFALKLPKGYWLFGADGQLQSDIDQGQIEYFRNIAERHMRSGERVILCLASPGWIYAAKYAKYGGYDEADLVYLLRRILQPQGVSVQVFLSGDLHHYRRHEEVRPLRPEAPVQKITAGGGGAFAHPTHGEDIDEIVEQSESADEPGRRFAVRAAFPSASTSRWLALRNLLFPFLNPWFGVLPAIFYLLASWVIGATVRWQAPRHLFDPLLQTARAFRDNPGVFLAFVSVLAGFVFFTDTHSRLYKWLGGLTHALAHYAALFYIGWGSAYLVYSSFPGSPLWQLALGANLVFWSGWLVGSLIVGVYLLVSFSVFGRHSEEAFSSLRIEDYKNFLRLHIREDGTLTVYPIGIDRVPRRWRARRDDERTATPSVFVSDDAEASAPRLIEKPIVLAAPGSRPDGLWPATP